MAELLTFPETDGTELEASLLMSPFSFAMSFLLFSNLALMSLFCLDMASMVFCIFSFSSVQCASACLRYSCSDLSSEPVLCSKNPPKQHTITNAATTDHIAALYGRKACWRNKFNLVVSPRLPTVPFLPSGMINPNLGPLVDN